MDIERLTTHQIILVCLLVSFVSSIATGIVTVSLFDQAPPAVTQTINRVVQTTVEKVVPSSTGTGVTKTIVVSEDEAIISAIDKASKGIVRIFGYSYDSTRRFMGFGVITDSSGTVVAHIEYDPGIMYKATLYGGVEVTLAFTTLNNENKLVFFKAENGQGTNARAYTPVSFGDSAKLKLGQTVVSLGGESTDSVTTGIISALVPGPDATNATSIRTDIYNPEYQTNAVAINLSGEVVGFKKGTEQLDGYVVSNVIKPLIPTK